LQSYVAGLKSAESHYNLVNLKILNYELLFDQNLHRVIIVPECGRGWGRGTL